MKGVNTIIEGWKVLRGRFTEKGEKLIEAFRGYLKNPQDRKKNVFLTNRMTQEILQDWYDDRKYFPLGKSDKIKLSRAMEAGMEQKSWLYALKDPFINPPINKIPKQLTLSFWKKPQIITETFKGYNGQLMTIITEKKRNKQEVFNW